MPEFPHDLLQPARFVPTAVAGAYTLWRSRLWRRYALVMVVLMVAGITGFGTVELAASFNDARAQAARLQRAQAGEAAAALQAALVNIHRHVGAVNELPWRPGWLNLQTRHEEFARLLRLVPSVETVIYRGAGGKELVRVSRRELDRLVGPEEVATAQAPAAGSGGPAEAASSPPAASTAKPASASPAPARHVSYNEQQDPVLDLELPDTDARLGGSTVIRVGLRALSRELRSALTLDGAEVYALDEVGALALHRDPSVMLARPRSPFAPPPMLPLPAGSDRSADGPDAVAPGTGLSGGEVLRAAIAVPDLGWWMVVERPRAAVMAPVWATVGRVAIFVSLGAVLALAAALTLAGRLSRPVRELHGAVAELAAGRLDTAIHVGTGDELEDLAGQFNQMAANLKASMTDLEDKVAAKTMDLQRANRHKSEFLANMSHELRTPLNAILGFADVLGEGMAGGLNDEQREYIGDIHASGLHLLALINDVLDLSKIEAGQLALEISEFDVVDTIASAMSLVRQRCQRKGLSLQLELAPELGLWRGDARRFKQVVVNLLGNAVKFTPPGGSIWLRGGMDPAAGLWIEVQDTGIGIAPTDHEAVFDEFRQVGGDSAGRAEGTGLGLSLVRRLVAQHGGTVTLESALGQGACFRFNIPVEPPGGQT